MKRIGWPTMRYRLSSLLLVVSLLGVVGGYFFNRAHVERRSRDELRKKGLTVAYDYNLGFRHVELVEESDEPKWLQQLCGDSLLDHVTYVDGQRSATLMDDGKGLTDDDLLPLQGLRHVECLYLGFNPITDEGLAHLAHLKSLRVLFLPGTRISDAGMAHLSGLVNLEVLVLEFTSISDDGLAHVATMRGLKDLALMDTRIQGPGLVHLASLSKLETHCPRRAFGRRI